MLGPSVVPEITDPAEAEKEVELAVLSAVAHGNGPNGLVVVRAAVRAFDRLDPELAMVYFQIIYEALREPLQRALEAMVMERQSEGKATLPPFAQKIFERGEQKGKLEEKREVLLRLLGRAGIALTEEERTRVQACEDGATLDRWVDNILGAKTAADVLSS